MRTVLLTTVAVLLGSLQFANAEEKTLVVNSYGGPYEAVQRKVIFEPFEKKYGVKVQVATVYSADMLAQLRAQKAAPQFDVVQFSGGQEILAAKEDLLAPLEMSALPNAANLYPFASEGIAKNYGPVALVTVMGLIYNEKTIAHQPKSWKDLWDPSYDGHVVLTDLSNTYGLQSFMMINKVWGGTLENWQPGLDEVKKILDGSTVITSTQEMQQNFAQSDAWIAPFAQDYAYVMRKAGLPVKFVRPQEGGSALYITMNAVKGRPNSDLAAKLIDFSLSPDVQVALAQEMRYSPTNRKAELPADVAAEVVHGDGLEQLVRFDPATVAGVAPKMVADWKRTISH